LRIEVADGTDLPVEDNTVDYWTCISVLEHIPGDADGEIMKEAGRVLKPGGIAVATVEGGIDREERWYREDVYLGKQYNELIDEKARKELGFEATARNVAEFEGKGQQGTFALIRRYDRERLMERLVNPSGLEVVEIGFLDQRFKTDFRCAIDAPHRPWWGELLKPFVALVSYWS